MHINGSVMPSIGLWIGQVSMGKSTVMCSFEVFPSGGSWAFLVGKPMQRSFGAIHNHATDKIGLPGNAEHEILTNQIHYKHAIDMLAFIGLGPTADVKQRGTYGGASIEPVYPSRTNEDATLERETKSGEVESFPREVFQDVQSSPVHP